MKTLKEHNTEIKKDFENTKKQTRKLNDIQCPECGIELYDIDISFIESNGTGIGSTAIECIGCGYNGSRLTTNLEREFAF